MKNREIKNLLARALAAIESPEVLYRFEEEQLVEDLEATIEEMEDDKEDN